MTSRHDALSDGELAAMAAAGAEPAFAALVRRHRAPLYRLIAANIADADEALDLVQESFVAAHGAIGRYDPARPMRSWLATIALNKCRDWHRRRMVRRFLTFARDLDVAADIAGNDPWPDVQVDDRQRLARLQRAIRDLPASLREPLVLHTVEGLSQAETARILSISEKAVETRLRRARQRLAALRD